MNDDFDALGVQSNRGFTPDFPMTPEFAEMTRVALGDGMSNERVAVCGDCFEWIGGGSRNVPGNGIPCANCGEKIGDQAYMIDARSLWPRPIPVSERLPDLPPWPDGGVRYVRNSETVLYLCGAKYEDGSIKGYRWTMGSLVEDLRYINGGVIEWDDGFGTDDMEVVTHWMPLPPIPPPPAAQQEDGQCEHKYEFYDVKWRTNP